MPEPPAVMMADVPIAPVAGCDGLFYFLETRKVLQSVVVFADDRGSVVPIRIPLKRTCSARKIMKEGHDELCKLRKVRGEVDLVAQGEIQHIVRTDRHGRDRTCLERIGVTGVPGHLVLQFE